MLWPGQIGTTNQPINVAVGGAERDASPSRAPNPQPRQQGRQLQAAERDASPSGTPPPPAAAAAAAAALSTAASAVRSAGGRARRLRLTLVG